MVWKVFGYNERHLIMYVISGDFKMDVVVILGAYHGALTRALSTIRLIFLQNFQVGIAGWIPELNSEWGKVEFCSQALYFQLGDIRQANS